MTEQEIRKQVKQRFRRMRFQNFLEGLKNVGLFLLFMLIIGVICAPFIIHMMGTPSLDGSPKLNISHSWMIATGILALPFSIMMVGGFIGFFIVVPIMSIRDKIKEHKESFEYAVEREIERKKRENK